MSFQGLLYSSAEGIIAEGNAALVRSFLTSLLCTQLYIQ